MDLDVRTEGTTIRQFVGYMPEYDCLPPDTSATDFVTHMARMSGLPSTAARERTAEVLRHVGLYEERYRAIGGYSTGMKQRVKLAQALVHDPRLLLLDEPTNGLDPAGRDEMLALVRRTGTEFGIAVIVASHLLGEIERVCDFLVAIDAGRLLRAAPLGSFTERTGVLAVEVEEGEDGAGRRRSSRAGLQAVADGRTVLLAVAEERPVRHRPRRSRGAGAAARPARAAPPEPRGPVPGRRAGGRGPGRIAGERRSVRHGVAERGSVVSGSPAQPARQPRPRRAAPAAASTTSATRSYDGPRLGSAQRGPRAVRADASGPASGSGAAVAPRSRRSRWPGWPSCRPSSRSGSRRSPRRRDRPAARSRTPRRSATTTLPRHRRHPDHAVLRGAGARAVRARPALRRPAALLLAGADPHRLRAGQAGRPDRRPARSSSSRRTSSCSSVASSSPPIRSPAWPTRSAPSRGSCSRALLVAGPARRAGRR